MVMRGGTSKGPFFLASDLPEDPARRARTLLAVMGSEHIRQIDGVPGRGAPIVLNFLDGGGAKTGALLPTGRAIDLIGGVEVSCVDFASPLVLIAAAALAKTGHENKAALDADRQIFDRVEMIRLETSQRMGLGDATGKVLPKVALLAPPAHVGNIASRYLTPWTCHAAHAVTGALCVAAACHVPGSVAHSIASGARDTIVIEHLAGKIQTCIEAHPIPSDAAPPRAHRAIATGRSRLRQRFR